MTCPNCGTAPTPGLGRCPSCGEAVAPPVEGALAPDPRRVTPPGRSRGADTLRDIPGFRRRESTWKDEVRERVKNRRQQRSAPAELPLFRDALGSRPGEEASALAAESSSPASPDGAFLSSIRPAPPSPYVPAPTGSVVESGSPGLRELGDEPTDLRLPVEDDLEMRPVDRSLENISEIPRERASGPSFIVAHETPSEEDHAPRREEWSLDEGPAPGTGSETAERPATLGERFQAGVVDGGLILALWVVVIYFASCAARVSMIGLVPAWPYLAAYLAFLGLAYAGYFTGTTGQTLGKILMGLRVVDAAGQPPGYIRAFVRAAVGALGLLVAALGIVSAVFDPARRTFHDRLLRTRVVKS